MTIAVLDNTNTVVAVVDAQGYTWNAPVGTTTVPATDGVVPGYTYSNGVFTAPIVAPVQPIISFLQFMALFSPTEQAAIVNSTDTQIKLFILMATGSGGMRLTDAPVIQGVNYAVSIGLLTSQRAAQILAGTPPS